MGPSNCSRLPNNIAASKQLSLKTTDIKMCNFIVAVVWPKRPTNHTIDIRNVDLDRNRVKIRFGHLLKTTRFPTKGNKFKSLRSRPKAVYRDRVG